MKSFIIKKLNQELEIEAINYDLQGFVYKTRKNPKYLEISEITIISPEIINALIKYNFDKKYKKILELYLKAIDSNDDSTEGAFLLALDEVARLKSIIITKYSHFLKKKGAEQFLKRLKILENELRAKIIDFKLIKEAELSHNKVEEEERAIRR